MLEHFYAHLLEIMFSLGSAIIKIDPFGDCKALRLVADITSKIFEMILTEFCTEALLLITSGVSLNIFFQFKLRTNFEQMARKVNSKFLQYKLVLPGKFKSLSQSFSFSIVYIISFYFPKIWGPLSSSIFFHF